MGGENIQYNRMIFKRDPKAATTVLKKFMAVVVCDGRDWTRMVERVNINIGNPMVCPEISAEGYPNIILPFLNEFEVLFIKGDEIEPVRD